LKPSDPVARYDEGHVAVLARRLRAEQFIRLRLVLDNRRRLELLREDVGLTRLGNKNVVSGRCRVVELVEFDSRAGDRKSEYPTELLDDPQVREDVLRVGDE